MKRSRKPIAVTLIALSSIVLAIAYNGYKLAHNAHPPKMAPDKAIAPDVSIIKAQPSQYQAIVNGYGEAKAHWSLSLKAQVKGEVIEMNKTFVTGSVVTKGTVLANIDNSEYLQALGSAKAELAEAKLALQEEQDLGEQAKREWLRSGLTEAPSSPLVFRTLQLEAAQANADFAYSSLKTAERDEENTKITAPFDAVVLTRDVDLGSYVNIGDTITTLNSTDKVEISVPLSLMQWENLNTDLSGQVKLQDITTGANWLGYIARIEHHIDNSTRQRNVIVALDAPFKQPTPLLPGTFLSVEIEGKTLANAIKLPSSAISQNGKIWYLNSDNTLANISATKLFEQGDFVYIAPIPEVTETNIVTRPLVSYLSGMAVNPVIEEQQ